MSDRAGQRVGDAEREVAVALLREAVGDGRLDLDELDERLGAAYAARTRDALAAVTADLVSAPRGGDAAPVRRWAVLASRDVGTSAALPGRLSGTAVLGTLTVDLRQAEFADQETVLTVRVVLGGVTVLVPPHLRVEVEGTGVLGGFTGPTGLVVAQLDDESPTLRVRGLAVAGGCRVERRQARRAR